MREASLVTPPEGLVPEDLRMPRLQVGQGLFVRLASRRRMQRRFETPPKGRLVAGLVMFLLGVAQADPPALAGGVEALGPAQ